MPALILNMEYRTTEYCKRKNFSKKKKPINTKEMYDYYDRSEAVDVTIQDSLENSEMQRVQNIVNEIEPDEDIERAYGYYEYRVGSTGAFNQYGPMKKNQCNVLAEKYRPEVIWRFVFSFEDEFAINNGIKEKSEMQKLIRKSMPKIIRAMGFDPDNVEWAGFYHTNTKSPHVHVSFYEKKPTKKTMNPYTHDNFTKLRSNVFKVMQLNTDLYVHADIKKKQLMETLDKCDLSTAMKNSIKRSFNCSKSKKGIKLDRQLVNMLFDLEAVLPREGSMKFNSANMAPYKEQIREVVQQLAGNEQIRPFLDAYEKMVDQEVEMQQYLYGTGEGKYKNKKGETVYGMGMDAAMQQKFKEDKMKRIETQMANLILQNIKDFRKDMKFYEKEMRELSIEIKEIKSPKKEYKGERRRNFSIRSKIMGHTALQEMGYAIQTQYYALLDQKQKIQDVTQRAQEDIRNMNRHQGR